VYVRILSYCIFKFTQGFTPIGIDVMIAFKGCYICQHIYGKAVADLEIFKGGFSLQKTPAKLEAKTKKKKKKKGHHQLFLLTAASLAFSTAPKPTH